MCDNERKCKRKFMISQCENVESRKIKNTEG